MIKTNKASGTHDVFHAKQKAPSYLFNQKYCKTWIYFKPQDATISLNIPTEYLRNLLSALYNMKRRVTTASFICHLFNSFSIFIYSFVACSHKLHQSINPLVRNSPYI